MSAPAMIAREPAPRRVRLVRYGLWQLRDYSVMRGLPTFLIAGMFGALGLIPMLRSVTAGIERMPPRYLQQQVVKYGSVQAMEQSMRHELSGGFLRGFIGTVVFLGALFAMNGLVSNDRKLGHYRFLFSKPVSPLRYYGQAFLIHWAGFVVVVALLATIYGVYVERVLTPAFLLVPALLYLMYAGLAFLTTTLVRWDWLALAGVAIAAQVLWDKFGSSTSTFARLLYLLPPMHRTADVYRALVAGTALPWHDLAWIAGYGAACLAAGLVVLRTQRLALP